MNLSTSVLGSHAVEQLRKTASAAVLQIGFDQLTRADLARVGCYNFLAARILTHVLHAELKVKSLKQVFDEVPPSALALPRLGVVCLAVLGAAFEAKRIGGEAPLEAYVRKHAIRQDNGKEPPLQTWSTLKKREQAEIASERKEKKARKAARRNKAHQLRTERFETRTTPVQ